MRLKPKSQRKLSVDEVIQQLRPKLAQSPAYECSAESAADPNRGQLTKSQYQYTLQSPDIRELYHYAPLLADQMRNLPGFQDVTTDLQIKNPEVKVEIDRDKAATLGVSAEQIEDGLYTADSSRQISTIHAPNNQYRVIMELQPEYQMDLAALSMLDCSVLQQPTGAARYRGQADSGSGSALRESFRTASRSDHLL